MVFSIDLQHAKAALAKFFGDLGIGFAGQVKYGDDFVRRLFVVERQRTQHLQLIDNN